MYRANVLNGKPTVRFDASDDGLQTPAINYGGTPVVTVYAVFSATSGGDRIVFESSPNTFTNVGAFAFYRDFANRLASWGRGNVGNNERWSNATLAGSSTFALASGVVDFAMHRHETYTYLNGDGAGQLNTESSNQANNAGAIANYAGNIGSRNNGASLALGGDIAELLVYAGLHNAGARKTVEDYLANKWNLNRRTIQANIVFEGDSLTEAGNSYFASSYPQQLVNRLSSGYHFWNPAVSGQTVAQMQLDFPAEIRPLYSTPISRNVCAFWGGTNDLRFGASMTTTLNRITSYAAELRGDGFATLVLTMLPRSDPGTPPTFEADRQSINTYLRSNWQSFANGLVDVAADGRIGPAGSELNQTFYDVDLVHLNANGLSIIADYVGAAFTSFGIS